MSLLLDSPPGFALRVLPIEAHPLLVITENRCVHYLRDLLDFKPEALLATPQEWGDIYRAAQRVARGESFYDGPRLDGDGIAPRERAVLRLVALGLGNREIALQLGVGERTIANCVSEIRDKLNVRNRVELTLHYLGLLPPKE